MLLSANRFLLPFLFLSTAYAGAPQWPSPEDMCTQACADWTSHITWSVPNEITELVAAGEYYAQYCGTPVIVQSIFDCTQVYCTAKETKHGLKLFNETCQFYANMALPSFVAASSDNLDNVLRVPQSFAIDNATTMVNRSIIPDAEWWALSKRTEIAFYRAYWFGIFTDWAMYGYWGLVFLVGTAYRIVSLHQPMTLRSIQSTGILTWLRRHVALPAMLGTHCQDPRWGATVPPRVESILLLIFGLVNFVIMFPGYDVFPENMFFETGTEQLSRYIADRAGFLALANLPVLWLFAMRNSPLMWLTGWSYMTFSNFHRWVGRIVVIHSFIHGVAYTIYAFQYPGTYQEWFPELWFWTGVMTLIAMCLLLGASIWWLRQHGYEVFLLLHIVLSAIALVGLYYHIQVDDDVWNGYIWPCVAIWSLDRIMRIARVIWIRCGAQSSSAIATFDKGANMVRLDITAALPRSTRTTMPGLYYFLYTPLSFRGYECHPMTLCSWSKPGSSLLNSSTDNAKNEVSIGVADLPSPTTESATSVAQTFLIRPYTSFTSRLLRRLNSASTASVPILLEGPYGSPLDLSCHSDVLLLSAGSGIAAGISHVYHLLNHSQSRVQIVWVVPQRQLVEDVCQHELASALRDPRVHLTVHLAHDDEQVSKLATEELHEVVYGRPDILQVMRDARAKAEVDLGITNCGTPGFADACRAAVVKVLAEPGKAVAFYNESISW